MRNGIQKKSKILCLMGLFFLTSGLAKPSQAFDVSLLGGTTLGNMTQISQVSTSSSFGLGYGFGGLLAYNLIPFIGLETGVFYAQHLTTLAGVGGTTVNGSLAINGTTIPILLRLNLASFIAFELGGYLGVSSSATLTSDITPAAAVAVVNDNGLLGGVSLFIPLAPMFRIRIAGFYQFGLANVTSATVAQNSQNIDIYGGFNFGF